MSDAPSAPARPVSLFTTLFIFALLAGFFFLVRYYYTPTADTPQNAVADNFPKDSPWKATRESRQAALQELREKQAAQAGSYAWVDKNAGVVQLPIDRAMELTAAQYAQKK